MDTFTQLMLWDDEENGLSEVIHPQCHGCIHLNRGRAGWPSCNAFERIPVEILTNEFDHTRPHPGDNGVQFESAGRLSGA